MRIAGTTTNVVPLSHTRTGSVAGSRAESCEEHKAHSL
jgi:hypothetical protein